LIGLHLALEKGYTGRQVQLAHMELGRTKRTWAWFDPPTEYRMTVADVLQAEPGAERDTVLMEWAAAVWQSWNHAQDWTRQACLRYLKPGWQR